MILYNPVRPYLSFMQFCSLNVWHAFDSQCSNVGSWNLLVQNSCNVALDDQICVLASYGTEILYTIQKKASVWQLNGDGRDLLLFAGSENEDVSSDGPVNTSRFKQPVGICTERGSIVYICDAQTNSIKICTELKECIQFPLQLAACMKRFRYTAKVYVTLSSQQKLFAL